MSARSIISELLTRTDEDPIRQYCPVVLHPKQRRFVELDCREALFGGSAGGGKSISLLAAAIRYVRVPGYRAGLFRRTYSDLVLPEALIDVSHQWFRQHPKLHWNGERKTWTFPTRDPSRPATITFGYLDGGSDHLRYQGAQFQFIGFDELTQLELRQYLYLHSRLRRLTTAGVPLRVRAGSNPGGYGHHWVKDRFIDNPGSRVFVRSSWRDNPALDHEAYAESLASLDEITRRQLKDGEWVFDGGDRVYRSMGLLPELPPAEEDAPWSYAVCCDLGYVDATSFVVLAWRRYDPRIYVAHAETETRMTVGPVAERLRLLERQFGGFELWIADPASKQVVETLRREYQCPFQSAEKTDKSAHISLVNGEIEHGALVAVEPTTEQLIEEHTNLVWKDEHKLVEHPAHPNHAADALLYGWRKVRRLTVAESRPARTPAPDSPEFEAHLDAQYKRDLQLRESAREQDLFYG
jgi:hypothetical protein